MTVTEPARLDRVVQRLTGLSRAGVRGLLDHDCVTVNGSRAATPQMTLASGDVVAVRHDPHTRYRERPAAKPDPAYRILFEDDDLIVVDKAAHVLTVPTASGKGKTLIDALQRHINRGRPPKMQRRPHVVHRLDQGVSGVLVVAKRGEIAAKLKEQFAAHKPRRIYIAIVNGIIAQKKGTFRSHLVTDYALNRHSTKRPGKGELAVTHYEVIAHAAGASVVRVQLETGRRNQIRVHFAEAGHPVLGDVRYPRADSTDEDAPALSSAHPKWKARRLALHALSLEFVHPATDKPMRFEAELPEPFLPFMRDRR